MILYFCGWPVWRWYWRAIFMAASVASEPLLISLIVFRSPGVISASFSASRMAGRIRGVQRRREGHLIQLLVHGLDHAAVVVPHRHDEDPGQAIQVALAMHIFVPHPIGARHDQGVGDEDSSSAGRSSIR